MKKLFVLFIASLLYSYVAPELLSPSEAPFFSESPSVLPSDAPVVSESSVVSPSYAPLLSESPIVSPSGAPLLSPSSEPSNNDCSTVIYSMFDCLFFLTAGPTDLIPTKSCCDGVKTVLEYNPNCLCIALESSRDMGFELINRKALVMPSICNIPINPHCDDVAASPTASISTPAATTIYPSEPPTNLSPPAVMTPSPPTVTTSSPPAVSTPSSPTFTTPSSPTFTTPSPSDNPSTVRTASPRTVTQSSPAMSALSPAIIAPSLSKSGATNLSKSKIFLRIVTISTFAYVVSFNLIS